MLGAIAGDIIGSVYEAGPIKTTDVSVHRDPPGLARIRSFGFFRAFVVARYRARFSYPIDKIFEMVFDTSP